MSKGSVAGQVYYLPPEQVSTYLDQAFPDSNFYDEPMLLIRSLDGRNARAVFRFDFGDFVPPPGGILDSAILGIYLFRGAGITLSPVSEVIPLIAPFEAVEVTWSAPWTEPGGDFKIHPAAVSEVNYGSDNWATWEVTDLLNQAWNEVVSNGFVLKFQTENLPSPGIFCDFLSERCEYNEPYLKLVYKFPSAVELSEAENSNGWGLEQNYPNPFNGTTTFFCTVNRRQPVEIAIFNLLGEKVAVLHDGITAPGTYVLDWNAASVQSGNLPSGVYFCRMKTDGGTSVIRLAYLK
ncbi:MAG: DNRLRE domain-containing protein [Candidatus Zixiibacteriota bacterium]|nr:MAG: DNRLRE domain-containing protein [candidate division Zixibacteria bacterium]